jgi:hypothetical protein
MTSSKQKGDALEKRLVRAFLLRGQWPVRRSVMVRDRFGNLSEIDVVAGVWPFKTYVECKNYTSSVPLEAVAKFKEVLSLNSELEFAVYSLAHYTSFDRNSTSTWLICHYGYICATCTYNWHSNFGWHSIARIRKRVPTRRPAEIDSVMRICWSACWSVFARISKHTTGFCC